MAFFIGDLNKLSIPTLKNKTAKTKIQPVGMIVPQENKIIICL
jgi:hypothetical protein